MSVASRRAALHTIWMCSDALCMGEATHEMPHPVQRGLRVRMCSRHHEMVLSAAKGAGIPVRDLKITQVDQ